MSININIFYYSIIIFNVFFGEKYNGRVIFFSKLVEQHVLVKLQLSLNWAAVVAQR